MGRFLNVGIIQMPCSGETAANLAYIEEKTERLMQSHHKPDLVVGVECMEVFTPETIPGPISDFFASIAKNITFILFQAACMKLIKACHKGGSTTQLLCTTRKGN